MVAARHDGAFHVRKMLGILLLKPLNSEPLNLEPCPIRGCSCIQATTFTVPDNHFLVAVFKMGAWRLCGNQWCGAEQ